MSDNIGGIKSPKLVSVNDIDKMQVNNIGSTISLNDGKTWVDLPDGRYGTSVSIVPDVSDAGTAYSITASIQIPRQNMTDKLYSELTRLVKGGIVMSYMVFSNETFIAGTLQYPLRGKIETLQAQLPGGFSGFKISLSGKQTIPQQRLL